MYQDGVERVHIAVEDIAVHTTPDALYLTAIRMLPKSPSDIISRLVDIIMSYPARIMVEDGVREYIAMKLVSAVYNWCYPIVFLYYT